MRRFLLLAVLLCLSLPFGVSLAGCSKGGATTFCKGAASGLQPGQTTTLNLEPRLTGLSLNQGAIAFANSPTATDCNGNSSSAGTPIYGSTDINLVDIQPAGGRICAGSWNRMTGGGVPDFTTCTPTTRTGVAYITASSQGVTSNPIPVYVHAQITSIVLGPASTNCVTDPASNCAFDATTGNGCSTAVPSAVSAYNGTACLSQGATTQLVARSYTGNTTTAAGNISCRVGPISFSAQDTSILTINQNGLATAVLPGATTINAATTQSSSTAGFFATCPPASIVLTAAGSSTPPTAPLTATQNIATTLKAVVTDTNGVTLNNVNLTYVSTSPTTIPASQSVITPTFPGAAAITALCQPATCNPAPQSQVGLFGTGLPATSNPVQIVAGGSNLSTVLYIGSTGSQYIQPVDFTQNTQPSPVRLPYVPNSMVISQDLGSIYLGNATELMVFSTATNTLTAEAKTAPGTVLAVSPDNAQVVVSDAVRRLIYIATSAGAVSTQYGGVGTRAQYTPDGSAVYIVTDDGRMLVYSTFLGWREVALSNTAPDVAVTVPQSGVYLGATPGSGSVTARTNCPATTVSGTGLNQQTSNVFYPQADTTTASASRIAATNDGVHILGATVAAFTDIATNRKSGACPVTFTSTTGAPLPYTGAVPTAITGLLPTSDSAYAFVTYTGTGGVVPVYTLATGTLGSLTLQTTAAGAPIAPVAGVLAADNNTFFAGTSGDNLVHRLTRGTSGFTDTAAPVTPALPGISGGIATPNLLVQRPRRTTS